MSTENRLTEGTPWLTHRQAQIAATRVIRDDESKRSYEWVTISTRPRLHSALLTLNYSQENC